MKAPTPTQIYKTRIAHDLSQTAAGKTIYVTTSAWSRWESGERKMPAGLWELFQIKLPQNPADLR